MFDIAALPMTPTTRPSLENGAVAGDETAKGTAGAFDLLLHIAAAQGGNGAVELATPGKSLPTALPDGGKSLPDAVPSFAATSDFIATTGEREPPIATAITTAAAIAIFASDADPAPTEASHDDTGNAAAETADTSPPTPLAVPAPALFAAIIHEPVAQVAPASNTGQRARIAVGTVQSRHEKAPQEAASPALPAQTDPFSSPSSTRSFASVTMRGLAMETVVETAPEPGQAPIARPQTPATLAALQAQTPAALQGAAQTSPGAALAMPAASDTDAAIPADAPLAPAAPVAVLQTTVAASGDTQPLRAEPRTERIDFATLVDSIARARDEASPKAVSVAVAHTDFGRVSLRFRQDADGLSVAMSSPDPGFVRAVTAAGQADASAMNTGIGNPSGGADTPARQNAPAPSGGEPSSQARGGQPRQNESSARQPSANHGAAAPGDDSTPARGGIFA